MELNIALLRTPSASSGTMEIVERKGKGHPDTLCDALAEELSIALCRFYRERVSRICGRHQDYGGRQREKIVLTLSCAFIDRFVSELGHLSIKT